MPRVIPTRPALMLSLAVLSLLTAGQADDRVRYVGNASQAYQARKFENGKPRRETYVFAAGQRFDGATVDRSFEQTTVRQIAEVLAPSLTKQNYWPTKELADADLMLVVHWGVTMPQASIFEMSGKTTYESLGVPALLDDNEAIAAFGGVGGADYSADKERWDQWVQITDRNGRDINDRSTAGLLGYTRTLAKYNESPRYSAEQYSLLTDLRNERYFVIVRAYDLKATTKFERSHPVWTLFLNTSSPGNNFPGAVHLMSEAAAPHFGHTTGDVGTARTKVKQGTVDLGDMIILGEVQSTSSSRGGSR